MEKLIVLFVVFAVILTTGCKKSSCARSIGMRFAFTGYAASETDTVILKKYPKGRNFTPVIDSILVDSLLLKFINRNDTLFPSMLHIRTLLGSDYDYEVIIPSTNKTYRITDIKEEQRKVRKAIFEAPEDCVNRITSYALNGQAVTVLPNHEVAYLKK